MPRLLRDLHLFELAQTALRTAREVTARLQLGSQFAMRLDTLGLQLDMLRFLSGQGRSRGTLVRLIQATTENAKAVLSTADEPGPVAAILGQLIRTARESGGDVPIEAAELFARLADRTGSSSAALINLASAVDPAPDEILAYAKRIEQARYSEDVGFDLGNIVPLARRLLAGEAARSNSHVAVFAIELLADRAIAVPG